MLEDVRGILTIPLRSIQKIQRNTMYPKDTTKLGGRKMNTTLDLMRKRIQHTRNKQQEDYEKELALRLAKRGIRYPIPASTSTSSTIGGKKNEG